MDKYISKIQKWIKDVIKQKSWKNYSHIHIDDIESNLPTRPDEYYKLCINVFIVFQQLLDKEFQTLLVIPLIASENPIPISNLQKTLGKWIDIEDTACIYFYPKTIAYKFMGIGDDIILTDFNVEQSNKVIFNSYLEDGIYYSTISIYS